MVVVGGGDTAMEEANFTRFASKVRCSSTGHLRKQDYARTCHEERKTELLWNTVVQEVQCDENGVTGVTLLNRIDETTRTLPVTGYFDRLQAEHRFVCRAVGYE